MKLTAHIAVIPVMVTDQEKALAFYTQKLGLEKRTDMSFAPGLRLLTVAARGQRRPEIALARPERSDQDEARSDMPSARRDYESAWIFETDDCCKTYETLTGRGVKFISGPTQQLYGVEAVFEDPDGNTFILLEASPRTRLLFKDRCVGKAA